MATERQVTIASTWAFDNAGANDLQAKFKADPSKGGDVFCKYDPRDDVFLLDVGYGAEPETAFTRLMTSYIDDEKSDDLMEKPKVQRIAIVEDPAEAAAIDDDDEDRGALVDVGFGQDQSGLQTALAPPGFCEKHWVSAELGGPGCFSRVSSDVLRYLEILTGTDIFLEDDKIRITGSHSSHVESAMERLTCLEKPFSMTTWPPVENIMQTYDKNDYRLQFQKLDNLPDHSVHQILMDPEAVRTRERILNSNITLLLIFDSDNQRFVPMRNAPVPINTAPLKKGRSRIWAGFQFPEMGQPENNPESQLAITSAAADTDQPAGSEGNADLQTEPPEIIDDHPYMTQEKAALVNNWVKGAAKEAASPDTLLYFDADTGTQKEKEKPVEVKKVGGVKTRRAVGSAMPDVMTDDVPVSTPADVPAVAPASAPASAPSDILPSGPSNAPPDVLVDDSPDTNSVDPAIDPLAEVDPSTPKVHETGALLKLPESKFANLAPGNINNENVVNEAPQPSPCTVVGTQDIVEAGPSNLQKQEPSPILEVPESKYINLVPGKPLDGKDAGPDSSAGMVTPSGDDVYGNIFATKKEGPGPLLQIPESKHAHLAPGKPFVSNDERIGGPIPSTGIFRPSQRNVQRNPSTPEKRNPAPLLQIPESKLLNLTPEKVESEKDTGKLLLETPPNATSSPDDPFAGPFTSAQPASSVIDRPVPVPVWPENFNANAYGPSTGVTRGTGVARGSGRGGRGAGKGAPRTPKRPRGNSEAKTPRGRTPGQHHERVTYHKPSGPPRLVDTSFSGVEVAKVAVTPMSFSQPALIPARSNSQPSLSDQMSSSSNQAPKSESQEENKESVMDAPVSEADTQASYEKRLRELKQTYLEGQDLEQTQCDIRSIRSKSQRPSSMSSPSRSNSQTSNKTIYQKRLEELERLRNREKMQVVSEIESRDYHRIMGQKAPAPQSQRSKGMSKAEAKAKRQAILEESWRIPSVGPLPAKKEKAPEVNKSSKERKEASKKAAAESLLMKLYSMMKPILNAARHYPGTLNLEIQFGLIVIPTLPGSYNGNMFEMKDWKNFWYPSHGLVAPSTIFINRLTTSGPDVDYILDLQDGKGEKAIRFFEEKPSKRDVSYEFYCKTKNSDVVIITISDTGDTVVTRPQADLGAVNVHYPSQTWDARVVLSSKFEYVSGINPELDHAIQVLVDSLYIPPNKTKATMYTRTSDYNELDLVKVIAKRATQHRYVYSSKKSDEETGMTTDIDGPGPSVYDDTINDGSNINETDVLRSDEPGVFLQITEVQNLFVSHLPNNRNSYHCRSRLPETMVDNQRLWYEVSIKSSAIDDMLLTNKELSPGECLSAWRESDILGKDAHIDRVQNPPKAESDSEEAKDPKNELQLYPNQASAIGDSGLGEMLHVASRVISRLDGVGFWNQGPYEMPNFETPIGLMITTAGENIHPSKNVTGGTARGSAGIAGATIKGTVGGEGLTSEIETGMKDMESASVRAALHPGGHGGDLEFW